MEKTGGGRLDLGTRLYNQGRFAEAEAAFASAAAEETAAPDASILKAFCRQALGDPEGASREMEGALKRFPASAAVLAQYGQLCVQQGRYARALVLARRARRLEPKSPTARRQEAVALAALGRRRDALKVLRRALRAAPDGAELWREAASAHAGLGEWRDALRCARRALRLEPGIPGAGRIEAEAAAVLRAGRGARRAGDAQLWVDAAKVQAGLGRARGARAAAVRAARLGLTDEQRRGLAASLADTAEALRDKLRFSKADEFLRLALRLRPGDPDLAAQRAVLLRRRVRHWTDKAKVQAGLGRRRGARAALLQAAELGLPEELRREAVSSLTDKAEALWDKGWFSRADGFMRLAFEFGSGDAELWFKQGVLLRHRGRYAAAEAAYKESSRLRPDRLAAYLYRAEALMAAGRVADVFRVLRRGRALCPPPAREDLEGWLQRYRLAAGLFDFEEAARIGEALLDGGRQLRRIEGLSWPVLVDEFEVVPRPPAFLRLAEAAMDALPRDGKAALWGRLLSVGYSMLPGGTRAFEARAMAESAMLARLPRSRYGWMRYATGCLRRRLGDEAAALADFRASWRGTRPPHWLALFHVQEILLSRGRKGEALRGLKRVEALVPENRSRDFLLKRGWFMLEAGRLAAARESFERVSAGARAPDAERGLRAVRAREKAAPAR